MKTVTFGKLLVVAVAVVLTFYPIQELTRFILAYQGDSVVPDLELFLMWWAYLIMPFALWSLLDALVEEARKEK